MRVFPLARRGIVVAAALALVSSTSAHADRQTVSQLQVELVQSRQQLNDLYAQSAAASEQLNGAIYNLQVAQKALIRQRATLSKAKKQLVVQQQAVAALTVEQLQSGSSISRLTVLFQSDGTQQLLERSSAYSSTNEAMASRIDALTARKVVYTSAARQAAHALADQRAAIAHKKAAQSAINASIEKARTRAVAVAKERRVLISQLAAAQHKSVDSVAKAQKSIDKKIDESGPDKPPTVPGLPKPPTSTPKTPKPPVTPPADPPPASGSKVETAIAFAKAQLGEPYKWGGAGPSSWDCSGLTMRAWQAAGVNLPHYAGAQYAQTTPVPISKIQRGDLLYWSDGGPSSIYHEALYLGGGQMIQAPRPGQSVEIVSLTYWIKPDLASRAG
jgi:cell wall-associated NlpC family hydrolase